MKMPVGSVPAATAAFRAWKSPMDVAEMESCLSASTLHAEVERPRSSMDLYGWTATKFDPLTANVTATWTSIWADPAGGKFAWVDTPAQREISTKLWDDPECQKGLHQNSVNELTWKARKIWSEVVEGMHQRLLAGDFTAFGRDGSPIAERVTEIPAAAWRHLSFEDWGAGTAISDDGVRVFDIHLADPAQPVGRRSKVGSVEKAIIALYPDGDYPPDKEMLSAIKARTGESLSPRTLSRAKLAIKRAP